MELDSRLTCAYIACLQANNYMLLLPKTDLVSELTNILNKQLFYLDAFIRHKSVSCKEVQKFLKRAEEQNHQLENLIRAIQK